MHANTVFRALALFACLLFAACGSSKQDAANAFDPDFTVVLPADVDQLDPRHVSDSYGLKISRLLFGSLVRMDPVTQLPVPDLAERVDVVTPTLYRVTLRPNLKFSDGSALDAQDVVATFQSLVDPQVQSRFRASYARIANVRALDALHVEMTLSSPHAPFIADLEVPIIRAEDARARLGAPSSPPPVSSGAYVLAERVAGRLDLRRNPHWHRGRSHFARVRFVVVRDDNTRAMRLLGHAGDYALNAIPPLLVPMFSGREDFVVQSEPGIGITYLGLNTASPQLSSLPVRQAIASAIDRSAIVEGKFLGRAHVAKGLLPDGHWADDATIAPIEFNVAQARALVASANLSPAQRHVVLRTSADRFRQSIARAIAEMLGEIGFDVEVRATELSTLLADLQAGRFDLTVLQIPEITEPHVLHTFFASDRIPSASRREGANRWRFANAEMDAALERGRASTDIAVRREAYARVQRILREQLPVIPLWHEDVVSVQTRASAPLPVFRDARFHGLE